MISLVRRSIPVMIAFCAMTLGVAAAQAADDPFAELVVFLDASAQTRRLIDAEDGWADACEELASAFVAGTGPWGLGPFAKARCAKSWQEAPKASAWYLQVLATGDAATLAMYRGAGDVQPGKSSSALAKTSFQSGKELFSYLEDQSFTRLLALALLDNMPALGRIEGRTLTERSAKGKLPAPPDRLAVYQLTWNPSRKTWQPRAAGNAVRSKNGGWRLPASARIGSGPRFVHHRNGIGVYAKSTAEALEKEHARLSRRFTTIAGRVGLITLSDAIVGGTSEGFVGVRYGQSFFQGPVIEDMRFIGLVAELRGAPLDGLRFYFDMWPEARANVEMGAESFSSRRGVIGWSFGTNIGTLLDRVDIVPKVGLWSVKTGFRVPTIGEESSSVEFAIKNTPSLGLELGIEKVIGRTLSRAWVASDLDFAQLGGSAQTSVVDTRFGFDLMIKGPSFGLPVNFSPFIFTFYESVVLNRSDAQVENLDGVSVSISGVDYKVGYIGGGLAISY